MPRASLPLLLLFLLLAAAPARADTLALTADHDTTLYEDASGSLSNGSGDYIFSGLTAIGFTRRALLHFDLSSLPQNASITSATVSLTMSRGGSSPVPFALARVSRAWGESTSDAPDEEGVGAPIAPGDAGWIHSLYPSTRWSTPGGDFISTASTITTISDLGPYSFPSSPQLLADLADMRAHPELNFGYILLGDELSNPPTAKRFNSRENPDITSRPTLTITYTIPTPATIAALLIPATLRAIHRRRTTHPRARATGSPSLRRQPVHAAT